MSVSHKIKVWLWPLLIMLLSIAVFQYLKATKPQAPATEISERAWGVEVMSLSQQDWNPHHTLYARVESNQRIKLVAPLSAEVKRLPFKEGALFMAGDTLLQLNPLEVNLTLQTAQAEFDEAQAAFDAEQQAQKTERKRLEQEQALYKIKQSDLARNQQLVARDLAAESSVDQARDALARQALALMNARLIVDQQTVKLKQLQARLDRSFANLNRTKLNVERSHVKAKVAGRVLQVAVAEGDQVNANSLLVEYYPLDSLELRAKLPAKTRLKIQQALDQNQPIQAWYRATGEQTALPLVRLAGEATSSGLDSFFQVPAELRHLRPGDVLEIVLEMPILRQGFAVPYSALYSSDRVYVVEQDRLVARAVSVVGEVELDNVRWALIEGELVEGDQLSVTHLPNAISGLLVTPQTFNGTRGRR
ncbi:MAG: HlyD family efflux transporter periplasmic adaptor subunit [Thiomicrospira sp.]|uniref:efflux RND transporter periplasmic adaptor subunit n=1 Tax=Thiomicrospira sp. TaxID=935 RepID=UPI001A10521E|nr:secretion protein HlyD [Thiomicrospira sp.]MBE0492840.1 HlyD family efflux transporter periplasmic adaptor subunit [Thiomicrospira sp.]